VSRPELVGLAHHGNGAPSLSIFKLLALVRWEVFAHCQFVNCPRRLLEKHWKIEDEDDDEEER
jgi:hypothetical protein